MTDFRFMVYSPEEDDEDSGHLAIEIFGWKLWRDLPPWLIPGAKITRKFSSEMSSGRTEYTELVQRAYGIWFHSENYLSISYGIQDEHWDATESDRKHWSWLIPWLDWTHVRHTIYKPDGTFFAELEDLPFCSQEREEAISNCPKIRYQIYDLDGEIIEVTAQLEERQWNRGRGWWQWLKYFKKPIVRRSIDIDYASEVGTGKGSWKGGIMGHGIDIEPGETNIKALTRLYKTHAEFQDCAIVSGSYREEV